MLLFYLDCFLRRNDGWRFNRHREGRSDLTGTGRGDCFVPRSDVGMTAQ